MTIRDAHGLDSLVLFAFIDICEGVNHWSHGSTGPEKTLGALLGVGELEHQGQPCLVEEEQKVFLRLV